MLNLYLRLYVVARRTSRIEERMQRSLLSTAPSLPVRVGSTRGVGRLSRPRSVELTRIGDQDWLRWNWDGPDQEGPIHAKIERSVLWSFLRLGDSPGEQILAFAQRWGVLELCEHHHLPASHKVSEFGWDWREWDDISRTNGPAALDPYQAPCRPIAAGDGWYMEPVMAWRSWSRLAETMLGVAAALSSDESGTAEEWRTMAPNLAVAGYPDGSMVAQAPLDHQRAMLSGLATEWTQWGRVVPAIAWDLGRGRSAGRFQFYLETSGLFGLIGTELITVIGSGSGPARCSRCGRPYQARRKPRFDRRNYCKVCAPEADRAAKRESARKRRARQRPHEQRDHAD